jgi:biotin synthase
MNKLQDLLHQTEYSRDDLIALLSLSDPNDIQQLYRRAYEIKLKNVGNRVYYRGIIELSNICSKNCYYCGIRRDITDIARYQMTKDEILKAAAWAYQNAYGSIVMQSGERQDVAYSDFITEILLEIAKLSNGELGITLSLGEQTRETYKRWFEAGAKRYLLRIETSSPELYKKYHPADHNFEERLNCLKTMKEVGYQTGTGVMIGLPGQTTVDLADDLLFFKKMDVDMIGMGPYIPHSDTPMFDWIEDFDSIKDQQLELGLKMIAAARILLKDINIASTTALQALHPLGREQGLQAGANIVMPNITDTKYRANYKLYNNKPCMDEQGEQCKECMGCRVQSIGEEVGFNEHGDSPHYLKKKKHEE